MRKLLPIILLLGALPASAQSLNVIYAHQFTGADQATRITNAQAACTANPCVIILSPELGQLTLGTLPTRGSSEIWIDYRTAGDFSIHGRIKTSGAALVAGDFSLSAGWGSTAAVGTITGDDQSMQFTVTSNGPGQGANPTATLTFTDGTWTNAPVALCNRQDHANQPTVTLDVATTATTLVITFNGTPVAAETYVIACLVGGI